MPFDECNHEGGGGGENPHDPDGLNSVAEAALISLSMNCERLGLCEYHAGLWMQGIMVQGLVATSQHNPGNESALFMIDNQIEVMLKQIETLKEERSKWT